MNFAPALTSFTPDSTLQQVVLKNYDIVVAVTQLAINETMGEYLSAQTQDFSILGIADENGQVTSLTTDPTKSNCSLSGTLALEKDPQTQKYINLIDLSTSKGNQTVQYNLTMQNGDFKFDAAGLSYEKKQDGTAAWIFRMFVDLSMEKVAKSDLPDSLKAELQNVDENMFSIQQLYLDLNTAALNSIDGVVFPALVETPAMQLLTLYLAQQQATNKPLFGVTVTFSNQTVAAPTLTPTFIDFCITPYTDSDGKNSNPNLDTLNYLMMVNHNTPPKAPPAAFSFNWVTDEQINGVMAIREDEFSATVLSELSPLLKTLCPVMYCRADGDKSPPDDTIIQLNPGTDHSFNSTYDANSGLIGSYSYNTSNSDDDHGHWYAPYTLTVSGNFSTTTNVFLNSNTIQLSGNMVASGDSESTINGSTSDEEMPNTTYGWSVDLELYFDAQNNGQLDLNITNPNFDSDPVVDNHDQSWWQQFLNGLSGYMQSYTENLGNLRGTVSDSIEGNISSNLSTILSTANHFIFPGAKSFSFKNPQFSNSRDLVSNITYLNPNS
ncbi:MAG TPA: hypothetical protein VM802_25385 [Chitinophaga sp.]|uniref:hypothetical protein n=1 Tax=Chitinophaga sp. TaxID=1869181 RepID=UPI002CA6CD00|nr:hypothetical protein [Chitinophaga sp.]HVI48226.1 hypothetical protein [Chitinophaga sp.]